MTTFSVIKTGGKQYLVKPDDVIIVAKIEGEPEDKVVFDSIMSFGADGDKLNLELANIQGQIVEQVKGDKVRIAKFKSKVRYRKVKGFRPKLTKIKILSV